MFLKSILSLAIVFMLSSCCKTSPVNEKYTGELTRNELSLQDNVSAKKLTGGCGGTKNFLVTNDSQTYVTRFIESTSQSESEIYNFTVASSEGYGPHIYAADHKRGFIIMEYLAGKTISIQDVVAYLSDKNDLNQILQSDQLYIELAHLLQRIHCGKLFKDRGFDVFKRIDERVQINKTKYENFDLIQRIEKIADEVHQVLLPHLTTDTPCHNDLHKGNIILLGSEIKAIDYGDAGQGDPYFDIATVSATLYTKPAHEQLLLTTYLGRQPKVKEKAKLYLMKQAFMMYAFFRILRALPPEYVQQYELLKDVTISELAHEAVEIEGYLSKPENKLKMVKAHAKQILDNFASQEFKDAVNALRGT